jgi:hypothetical protein
VRDCDYLCVFFGFFFHVGVYRNDFVARGRVDAMRNCAPLVREERKRRCKRGSSAMKRREITRRQEKRLSPWAEVQFQALKEEVQAQNMRYTRKNHSKFGLELTARKRYLSSLFLH